MATGPKAPQTEMTRKYEVDYRKEIRDKREKRERELEVQELQRNEEVKAVVAKIGEYDQLSRVCVMAALGKRYRAQKVESLVLGTG